MALSRSHSQKDSKLRLSDLNDYKLVPDSQISLFGEVLQFRETLGEGYHNEHARAIYRKRIQPLIKSLKFPIERPRSLVQLVLPKQSEHNHLCDLHQGLNADFVHQWFKLLALEVGARLEILRTSNENDLGTYAWLHFVKALTRLHKIWETPARLHEAFGDFVEKGFNQEINLLDARQQIDGCEACVLARVGGHLPTILALRAVIKSRITPESLAKHPKRLRLLRLVEHWLMYWQELDNHNRGSKLALSDNQLRKNDKLSEELWDQRQELELEQQRARRAQRHLLNAQNSTSKENEKMLKALDETADNGSIHDAENDIIDTYAALRQTQRTSRMLSALITAYGGVNGHEASERASQIPSKSNETKAYPTTKGPYSTDANPVYLESRYSMDTVRNNDRAVLARSTMPMIPEETLPKLANPVRASQSRREQLPVAHRNQEGRFVAPGILNTRNQTNGDFEHGAASAALRTSSSKFGTPQKVAHYQESIQPRLTPEQQAYAALVAGNFTGTENDRWTYRGTTHPDTIIRTSTAESVWSDMTVVDDDSVSTITTATHQRNHSDRLSNPGRKSSSDHSGRHSHDIRSRHERENAGRYSNAGQDARLSRSTRRS